MILVSVVSTSKNPYDQSKAEKPQATSLLKGAPKVDFLIRRRMGSYEPSGYAQPQSSTMMSAAQMQGMVDLCFLSF